MPMNLKNAIFGGSVTGISDRSGAYDGSIQAWLPIKDIVQGVDVTRDKRFVKILELLPVNFYTMSSMDKSAAIEDFAAYLKIAPSVLLHRRRHVPSPAYRIPRPGDEDAGRCVY